MTSTTRSRGPWQPAGTHVKLGGKPLSPGRAERHGFEYYRHGTLSLYASLDVKTGKAEGKTAKRHTSAEFVDFLNQVVEGAGGAQESIILDNLSAQKRKL